MPKRRAEAVDHHNDGAAAASVDVMQPLAVDLDELTARRHRGFDFSRGVGGELHQAHHACGTDQDQRQQNAHFFAPMTIRGPTTTTPAPGAPAPSYRRRGDVA